MYKQYKDDLLPILDHVKEVLGHLATAALALRRIDGNLQIDLPLLGPIEFFARQIPVGVLDPQNSIEKNQYQIGVEYLRDSIAQLVFLMVPPIDNLYLPFPFHESLDLLLKIDDDFVLEPGLSPYPQYEEPVLSAFQKAYDYYSVIKSKADSIEEKYLIGTENIIVITLDDSQSELYDYSDVAKEIHSWNFICRGLSRLDDDHSEVKVILVERGSLIIMLGLGITTILILRILKIWNSALDGKKKQNELREGTFRLNQLTNDALEEDLKKIIEIANKYPQDVAEAMIESIVNKYEDLDSEVANNAIMAIRKLVAKVFSGQKIEPLLISSPSEEPNLLEQIDNNQREIERQEEEFMQLDPEKMWDGILEEELSKKLETDDD